MDIVRLSSCDDDGCRASSNMSNKIRCQSNTINCTIDIYIYIHKSTNGM